MTETPQIRSFADVIDLWPNAEELATRLGEKGVTVRNWRNRGNNIPSEYWTKLVDIAVEDGKPVTLELLANLAAARSAA